MAQLTQRLTDKIMSAEGGYNAKDWKENYACGQLVGSNFGISPSTWANYTGRDCPTAAEMQAISTADLPGFLTWYGKTWRVWECTDQDFAELLFNAFYGSPKGAAKSLQRTLNQRGYALAEDGIMGSRTIAAMNTELGKDKTGLYNAYRESWMGYLTSLNNTQFQQGWMNRMNQHFPPLLPGEGLQTAPAETNYTAELVKSRVRGIFISKEDAAWVLVGAAALVGLVLVILKFRRQTVAAMSAYLPTPNIPA